MIEIVSHRGARFEAPENTVEGFRHALALGMTTVEFDVRLTADDHLVVIHDATVDRTTNGTGKVSELTLEQIQLLDARSVHVLYPTPVRVPTLAEVLDALQDMPDMEIEIKKDDGGRYEQIVTAILHDLAAAGRTSGAMITSFEPDALRAAKAISPDTPRGLIGNWAENHMWELVDELAPQKAGIDMRDASPEIVARAKAAGCVAVGWPCNDEETVRKVKAWGFDQVCTDAPSLFAPMFGRKLNTGA